MTDYMNDQVSQHFKRREFACKGCKFASSCPYGHGYGKGLAIIDAGTVNILEAVRSEFGEPVTVHSGFRCQQHNSRVGGAVRSQHLLGTAADISVRYTNLSVVYDFLDPLVTGGLSKYKTFIHLDTRRAKKRW